MSNPSQCDVASSTAPPKTWIEWKAIIMRSGSLSPELADAFQKFVQANPETIRGYKSTLHWVVYKNAPLSLVKAVVIADPDSLKRKEAFVFGAESRRVTPLGVACHCNDASPQVMRYLLRARLLTHSRSNAATNVPTGQKRKRIESSLDTSSSVAADNAVVPFYPFATTGWEHISFLPAKLTILLQEYPQGAIMSHEPNGSNMLNTILAQNNKTMLPFHWEHLNLVLMAASFGTVRQSQEQGQFHVLHALLELWCGVGSFQGHEHDYSVEYIMDFLNYIKNQAPRQFSTRDHQGRLPLHIVMMAGCHEYGWNKTIGAQVWKFLVVEYPESAGIVDSQGRLAIQVAIEYGINVIDQLVEANPRTLQIRAMATRMYPFELVAYYQNQEHHGYSESEELQTVNNIYKLLRMAPHVARTAIREPWVDSPEYLEVLRNNLRKAQIDFQRKLEMQEIDARNAVLKKQFQRYI